MGVQPLATHGGPMFGMAFPCCSPPSILVWGSRPLPPAAVRCRGLAGGEVAGPKRTLSCALISDGAYRQDLLPELRPRRQRRPPNWWATSDSGLAAD